MPPAVGKVVRVCLQFMVPGKTSRCLDKFIKPTADTWEAPAGEKWPKDGDMLHLPPHHVHKEGGHNAVANGASHWQGLPSLRLWIIAHIWPYFLARCKYGVLTLNLVSLLTALVAHVWLHDLTVH
jgi:hypothetical protein